MSDLVHRGVRQHLLQSPHGQGLLQDEAADGEIWRDVLKHRTVSTTQAMVANTLKALSAASVNYLCI